jgi:hypothetical protein
MKRKKNYSNNLYFKLFFVFTVILFLKPGKQFNLPFKQNLNISDKITLLKLFTNNNKFIYKGVKNCLLDDPDRQLCIYHLIAPKSVEGKERLLIGKKRDGSYVLLNDFKNIKIAYSFGISRMIQFDKYLANKGIDVYMYDHTINFLPYNNIKFHWKKIGITGRNRNSLILKSLEELIIENGHSSEKNMILKIDVEHAEWESLKDLSYNILRNFKYILIEYHFRDEKIINNTSLYYNVIKKLYKTHQVFYLRCQNKYNIVNFGNNKICRALEVSYIIRENVKFTKDSTIYPIGKFDFSRYIPRREEMNLNILKLFDNNNN